MGEHNYNAAFMQRAIELSLEGSREGKGGPFGAVVVKNGVIIGEGCNQVTSTNDPSAHAEIVAIRNACKHTGDFQLSGCAVYASCEPCPMCLGAIYWARPDVVYFASTKADAAQAGFDDAFIYNEIQIEPQQRKIPMIYKPHSEPVNIFKAWVQNPDKIPY